MEPQKSDGAYRSRVRTWVLQWNDYFKSKNLSALAPQVAVVLNHIKPYWPLKKGSVDRRILAWSTCASCEDVVQGSIAFFSQGNGYTE